MRNRWGCCVTIFVVFVTAFALGACGGEEEGGAGTPTPLNSTPTEIGPAGGSVASDDSNPAIQVLGSSVAVTFEWAQIEPFAVFAEDISSSTITIRAKISGMPSRVVASYFGNWFSNGPEPFETVQLYDDGSHGDKVAGDGIFTGQFVFAGVVPRLRRYGGQLDHLPIGVNIQDSAGKFIPFAKPAVSTVELGLVAGNNSITPERLSDHVMTADAAVNIVDAAYFIDHSAARVMETFYGVFPDDYDGFVMFSGGRTIGDGLPRGSGIRNVVTTGIGLQPFDGSAAYGSQGKLKYQVLMNNSVNGEVFLHEFAHSFGIYLNQSGLNLTSSGGLGMHWGTSDIIGQMRGGDYLSKNQDGSFTVTYPPGSSEPGWGSSIYAQNKYADLELYLMGLVPPEQVRPHSFLISDTQPHTQPDFDASVPIPASATRIVTIDDILQVYGVRAPGAGIAQKNFALAFILVSNQFVNTAELTLINTLARYYASGLPGGTLVTGGAFPVPDPPSFAAATNYFGSMDTSLKAIGR